MALTAAVTLNIHAAEQAVGVRPETALRLMELAADESTTAKQLEEVIDADLSMTVRTLKLANSAFFGMPTRVSRIDRAITMLGVANIAKLAASGSLESAFSHITIDAPGITAETPWRYAVAVALATEIITRQCPATSSVGTRRLGAEAFVAGLIHDLGTLVQARLAPSPFGEAVRQSLRTGLPLVSMEQRLIGIDHAQIGLMLARHWQLPPTLANAIGYHHEPLAADPEHRSLACVIYIAAQLVRRGGIASFDGDTDTPHLEHAMDHLHIDPLRIDKIATAIQARVAATPGK